MSDDLFPETIPPKREAEPRAKLSRDRARTLRAQTRILNGYHPMGASLREPRGETCGSCRHLITKRWSGTYFKCARFGDSNGPATDIRKSWPACREWSAREAKP